MDSGTGGDDELASLLQLGVASLDESALERQVIGQAKQQLAEHEISNDRKRLAKAEAKLQDLAAKRAKLRDQLRRSKASKAVKDDLQDRVEDISDDIKQIEQDISDIRGRIADREHQIEHGDEVDDDIDDNNEDEDEEGAYPSAPAMSSLSVAAATSITTAAVSRQYQPESVVFTHPSRFKSEGDDEEEAVSEADDKDADADYAIDDDDSDYQPSKPVTAKRRVIARRKRADPDYDNDDDGGDNGYDEYFDDGDEVSGSATPQQADRYDDDGDESVYRRRVCEWARRRHELRLVTSDNLDDNDDNDSNVDVNTDGLDDFALAAREAHLPHPQVPDLVIGDDRRTQLRIPGDIHQHLFEYQKTGLRWMHELHVQKVGGICSDQMGLGKTVQVAAFVGSMVYSRQFKHSMVADNGGLSAGRILVICPATLMRQWVQEFHKWWPALRVTVLHSTGSGMANIKRGNGSKRKRTSKKDDDYEDDEEEEDDEFVGGSDDEDDVSEFYHLDNRGAVTNKHGNSRSGGGGRGRGRGRGGGGRLMVDREGNIVGVSASPSPRPQNAAVAARAREIVRSVLDRGHVLITTYAGLQVHRGHILPHSWDFCVLDEGHKIRNPDAAVTLACKRIRTPHRIILSGTPIQNNLTELWSLYDFVYPGRLGTLPVFQTEFAVPINVGGFSNASNFQVQTAYRCACILRDLIQPFMLRRMKVDVASDLPKKTEQVLFCKLTQTQRALYKAFLNSGTVASIMAGKRNMLFGIDYIRKLCNHPDLLDPAQRALLKMTTKTRSANRRRSGDIDNDDEGAEERAVIDEHTLNAALADTEDEGLVDRSGKLQVVRALLKLWHSQGHRVLLFAQTRQMLDILEHFVKGAGYTYSRMDGTTQIKNRQIMIDRFNNGTPSGDSGQPIFVFLLTTKTGGLGTNLTGANRVIIYDPDWNPSTDMQARERAWRLGQTREVSIYRLMTAGTIEEKIYHRQVFKQFLTHKILKDPQQKRFFKANALRDLFSFADVQTAGTTETGDLFSSAKIDMPNTPDSAATEQQQRQQQQQSAKNDRYKKARYRDEFTTEEEVGRSKDLIPAKSTKRRQVDVADLDGVAAVEDYDPSPEASEAAATTAAASSAADSADTKPKVDTDDAALPEEERILHSLFSMSGGAVHSAVRHDVIMDADRKEAWHIEQEASKFAENAAKALRESRSTRRDVGVHVPTWTGLSGGARSDPPSGYVSASASASASPAPSAIRFGGAGSGPQTGTGGGSRALLDRIRARREHTSPSTTASSTNTGNNAAMSKEEANVRLLGELCQYIAVRGGRAKSSDIASAFDQRVGREESAILLFKSMLRQVATLTREPNPADSSRYIGYWVLKPEYA